jgi:hypothetical protein
MLPERTISEKSGLYRLQRRFYPYTPAPVDTCEFRARLWKIFLFWIPLILVFLVAPVVYFFVRWFVFDDLPIGNDSLKAIGATEAAFYALGFVIWVCFKIYEKSPVVLKTLGVIALSLAGLSALYFWILVFAGLSFFSGMTGSLFSTVVSVTGMFATACGLAYLATIGIASLFDSNTYTTLKTSAKERWCAKLRIVDESGKTWDERQKEEAEASQKLYEELCRRLDASKTSVSAADDLHAFEDMMAGEEEEE